MPAQSLGRDHYSLVKKGRENALLWRERQRQRKQIRNMSIFETQTLLRAVLVT